MNWDAIGTISDVVAAIAVVISLIYLAAQIRHNTRELDERNRSYRQLSLDETAKRYTNFRGKVNEHPGLASIWHRGRTDLGDLDEVERLRFDYLAVEMFWCWAMLYFYQSQGVMDKRVMELSVANLPLYAHGDGMRDWWAQSPHRSEFPPDFIREVDELLGGRDN